MTIERVYAVSDIPGHVAPLRAVLDLVDLDGDPAAERILLGDYVDRGPDSLGVLQVVRELQGRHPGRVTALLGNHDDWMLNWLESDDGGFSWLMGDAELRPHGEIPCDDRPVPEDDCRRSRPHERTPRRWLSRRLPRR